MQIVIKLPDSKYQSILSDDYCGLLDADLYKAIKDGTPLPKGHGRLIDEDRVDEAIYKEFDEIQCYDGTGYDIYSDVKYCIDDIPTIIEADRMEEK